MISWPLAALAESGLFDSIWVSTEDPEIEQFVRSLGASVIRRSSNLADDFTSTTEVLQDALASIREEISNSSWVYKIYPTTPAKAWLIRDFVEFTEKQASGFTVSVVESNVPIQRALTMSDNARLAFREPENWHVRTQDLSKCYFDAGKIYGGKVQDWNSTTSPLLESPRAFVFPNWAGVDMDTSDDWELAEHLFRKPGQK